MRVALFAAAAVASAARAHDFSITDTLAVLKPDGEFLIDLTLDLDELALGLPRGQDSRVLFDHLSGLPREEQRKLTDDLRATLGRRIRVLFDGRVVEFNIDFPAGHASSATLTTQPAAPASPEFAPDAAIKPAAQAAAPAASDTQSTAAAIVSFFGITARITGRAPPGAKAFVFRGSRALGPVRLTIVHPYRDELTRHLLSAGEECPPYPIPEPATAGGATALSRDANSQGNHARSTAQAATAHGASDAWCVAGRYLKFGFEHILPLGADHILFVLGLFLLSTQWKSLLWQVTAFTIAHSITLALTLYGVVSLSHAIVEPLIAASIIYVGVENLLTSRLHPWRPAVVFLFGLLHGMGFAGVLAELGLPRGEFLPALIGFNIGVELGQLAVIGLALAAVGWWRGRAWYRRVVVVPASTGISLMATYWLMERTM